MPVSHLSFLAANDIRVNSSLSVADALNKLRADLRETLLVDRRRLKRELDRLAALAESKPQAWKALSQGIAEARARYAQRLQNRPVIQLDDSLPITAKAEVISDLIRKHQVIVIAGETGSGKTTQLPKLCLVAGRGKEGLIGCTQPRRIAARNVARRVADELGTALGTTVGYQVRFNEQVGENALIKFMTDGILLAETQGDAWLNRYDTLIIDEAHERSLNIDFLLGYLKRLLTKRRDLKLIITSATIDTARFAEFFNAAPVLQIEGRGYPVEVRYRPWEEAADKQVEPNQINAIIAAVDEITHEDGLGDILVFLAGEREIRETHLALEKRKYRETEVLPLYARLSGSDQDRVFKPGLKRRIVLATNVAETSLTVPRIRYVIDPGSARVKRYSQRTQIERLHIEPISQAAADQRKGRCGRIAAGVCVRLYSEDDFAQRPRYTDPEIMRTSLAGVILRMLSLRLGEVEQFPFVEAPPERAIADGYRKLGEIGAIDGQRRITELGKTIAQLPVDVALGRMLVEARDKQALRELHVLTAFLSTQDPRERPSDARVLADAAHAAFADKQSDFVGVLQLWAAYQTAHAEFTQSRLRDWCQAHFLSYLRMREWRELHRQLLLITQELGWAQHSEAASFEAVHRCLLSGWPTQVARRDERGQYQGARQRKYQIFPGSALAKHAPAWLLSGQILDTQRVYALNNARIEPLWIEQQCVHLLKRSWRDPHWSRKQGAVMAFEQVTLFGLTLVERRPVRYAKQNSSEARAVFIRQALVPGEIDCRADFVRANARVLYEAHELEARQRRQGMLRSDDELCAFFEPNLPANICTTAALDTWYRHASPLAQAALHWSLEDMLVTTSGVSAGAFPATLELVGTPLQLQYRFVPGDAADGVTLHLPLALLNAVDKTRIEWLVPGLLEEKVAALIRGLPKAVRRNFVPAPDFARAFCEAESCALQVMPIRPLLQVLAAFLQRTTGVSITPDAFDETVLDAHLRMRLSVFDEHGKILTQGRNLLELQYEFGAAARAAFSHRTDIAITREHISEFDMDEIPEMLNAADGLQAFPALVDLGETVALRVFESQAEATMQHRVGVQRLLRRGLADQIKQARRQLPLSPALGLKYAALGSIEQLREDLIEAAFLSCCAQADLNVRTRVAFEHVQHGMGRALFSAAVARLQLGEAVITAYIELLPWLEPPLLGFARANYDDLHEQLTELLQPGFLREVDSAHLVHYPRYLRAMRLRAERLRQNPARDQVRMSSVQPYWRAYLALRAERGSAVDVSLSEFRWLIEELRVSLFAQELKTAEAVSGKRLNRLLDTLRQLK